MQLVDLIYAVRRTRVDFRDTVRGMQNVKVDHSLVGKIGNGERKGLIGHANHALKKNGS